MVAPDTAWLSPFNDGPCMSIAVHTHAPDESVRLAFLIGAVLASTSIGGDANVDLE